MTTFLGKKTGDKPSLLILTFSYAPMGNPRSFRWTALAEEFASRGFRVQVVCSWQPGLAKRQIHNGVEVYRVGNRLIETIRASLAQIRRSSHPASEAKPPKRSGASAGRLGTWFWRKIAWPDTTCVWYDAAKKMADSLLQKHIKTTVISVSPSFTAALAGYSVVKKNGVRWVLDMGDPFSIAVDAPANNFSLYKTLNMRVERTLFQRANALTLTNNKVLDRYALMYPECADKMHVIPPLLTDSVFRLGVRSKRQTGESIKIVFVGTLYKHLRKPDFLLALFDGLIKKGRLPNAELHFWGNCEECIDSVLRFKQKLGPSLQLHGVVSQQDTLVSIGEANVVVNLGNTNNCQLPSKLVEYTAMGKPILNIISTENDPSEDFLKDYHAVLNIRDIGKPPTLKQIDIVYGFVKAAIGENNSQIDNRWQSRFRKEAIADQYESILFEEDHLVA